jgi:hypothetical protein
VVQDMLRSYVDEARSDWDRHLTAVEIAINSSRHVSTGYTPHFLNHNQEMCLPFGIALKEIVAEATVPAAVTVMTEMASHDEIARSRLIDAQLKQKAYADQHRREEVYHVNDQVMLRTAHLSGYKHKLVSWYIGPFAITQVDGVTVTLALPEDMRIHDRVHVDKVKRYLPSVGEWIGRVQEDRVQPLPAEEDGDGQYEVEAILGKREETESSGRGKTKKVVRYLVAWAGYSLDDMSWVKAADLSGAPDLVNDYERKLVAESTGKASVMMLFLQ